MVIKKNASLKPYNTFGLEAIASYLYEVTSVAELKASINEIRSNKQGFLVLGGGSNILLTRDIDGCVIKNNILGKRIIDETQESVVVKFGAGENWHELVMYTLAKNWGGIQNLSLIPGTMGAAPMQNIGAYGVEIRDVFKELTALSIDTLELKVFSKKDCQFGYRESIFKNTHKGLYIIVDVTLELSKKDHELNYSYGAISDVLKSKGIQAPTIQDISDAVIEIRQSKLPDPKEIGNSGSFFKNPTIDKIDYEGLKAEFSDMPGYELPEGKVKVPAGWLIEKCGWKGFVRDHIGVHKNQALVLVNYGKGSGSDLHNLAMEIKESVAKTFGIELNPEVNII